MVLMKYWKWSGIDQNGKLIEGVGKTVDAQPYVLILQLASEQGIDVASVTSIGFDDYKREMPYEQRIRNLTLAINNQSPLGVSDAGISVSRTSRRRRILYPVLFLVLFCLVMFLLFR